MNGVAFNSQFAPSSTYAYHHHNGQYAAKSSLNRVPLANTVSNAAPNYLPPLTKQAVQVEESVDTKNHKRSEKELPSYSQIPTSIRKNGGNLPEFAAQVCTSILSFESKLTVVDCMSVLVRKDVETENDRGFNTPEIRPCTGSVSYSGISEMGFHRTVYYASQSERYTAGIAVHLPVEKVQSWSSRKEGKRVSVDDDCVDDGK